MSAMVEKVWRDAESVESDGEVICAEAVPACREYILAMLVELAILARKCGDHGTALELARVVLAAPGSIDPSMSPIS